MIKMKFSRQFLILPLFLLLLGCTPKSEPIPSRLSVGVVSFGESDRSWEQYSSLKTYLEAQLKSIVEIEPTYNEIKAFSEINNRSWDLVFAPPGLAAIAISEQQYKPLFPLEGAQKTRSVIIVRNDSALTELSMLTGKIVALGPPGSATAYYLPLYNLYGLTLAEIRLAPTPKVILEWIAKGEVNGGAMSYADFIRYRPSFAATQFRVLYTDPHDLPSGAVLVSSNIERNQEEQIRTALVNASAAIASSAGYIPNAPIPNYQNLIKVVIKVRPLGEKIKQKPVHLYQD